MPTPPNVTPPGRPFKDHDVTGLTNDDLMDWINTRLSETDVQSVEFFHRREEGRKRLIARAWYVEV